MLIDLHVHSSVSSCSELSPAEIIQYGKALGLDGVCITDHDTTDVLSQIKEGFQPNGLLVLVGMEYSTPEGHFLVYGPVEHLLPGMDARLLITEVRRMGGAVVAAHPFRGSLSDVADVISDEPCTAIEVFNGRNNDKSNAKAGLLAHSLGLTEVSGSDAHALVELGRCPTRFVTTIRSRQDLVEALKKGQCAPAEPLPPLSVE